MATNDDIDKFITQLRKFSKWINDKNVNLRLARKCREIIYRRVKSGKGVNKDDGDPETTEHSQLAPLSKSYKDYRKGLAIFRTMPNGAVVRFGAFERKRVIIKKKDGSLATSSGNQRVRDISPPTLGEFGKPEKSNLTLTGQMLDGIVLQSSETGFKLLINNKTRKGSKLTNAEVADFVSKGGSYKNGNGKQVNIPARPFFALTSGEIRIITRELETIIKEIIEKNMR